MEILKTYLILGLAAICSDTTQSITFHYFSTNILSESGNTLFTEQLRDKRSIQNETATDSLTAQVNNESSVYEREPENNQTNGGSHHVAVNAADAGRTLEEAVDSDVSELDSFKASDEDNSTRFLNQVDNVVNFFHNTDHVTHPLSQIERVTLSQNQTDHVTILLNQVDNVDVPVKQTKEVTPSVNHTKLINRPFDQTDHVTNHLIQADHVTRQTNKVYPSADKDLVVANKFPPGFDVFVIPGNESTGDSLLLDGSITSPSYPEDFTLSIAPFQQNASSTLTEPTNENPSEPFHALVDTTTTEIPPQGPSNVFDKNEGNWGHFPEERNSSVKDKPQDLLTTLAKDAVWNLEVFGLASEQAATSWITLGKEISGKLIVSTDPQEFTSSIRNVGSGAVHTEESKSFTQVKDAVFFTDYLEAENTTPEPHQESSPSLDASTSLFLASLADENAGLTSPLNFELSTNTQLGNEAEINPASTNFAGSSPMLDIDSWLTQIPNSEISSVSSGDIDNNTNTTESTRISSAFTESLEITQTGLLYSSPTFEAEDATPASQINSSIPPSDNKITSSFPLSTSDDAFQTDLIVSISLGQSKPTKDTAVYGVAQNSDAPLPSLSNTVIYTIVPSTQAPRGYESSLNVHHTDPTIKKTNFVATTVLHNESLRVLSSVNGYSFFPLIEAHPNWVESKHLWGYLWEVHIYFFGVAFGLVGLYIVLSAIRLRRVDCLFSGGYSACAHSLLLFLAATRSFYLLYDGYGSQANFHASVNHFLYGVSFPCLTSAFSILFFWVLKISHLHLVPPSLQKIQVLAVINVVHFLLLLATDVSMCFFQDLQVLQLACHVYFISWALVLCLCYVLALPRLHAHSSQHKEDVLYLSPAVSSTPMGKITVGFTISAAVKTMFAAALCIVSAIAMEIYAIFAVYRTFIDGSPGPLTWWVYHTVLRSVELLACFFLVYTVSLPLKYRRSRSCNLTSVVCAPCTEIFSCGFSLNKVDNLPHLRYFQQAPNLESIHVDICPALAENSLKKLLSAQSTDSAAPIGNSRPNSLLIIEDGYVRFQTDYDINRIVDSCNDLTQKQPNGGYERAVNSPKDGFVNTGYSLNPIDDKDSKSNNSYNISNSAINRIEGVHSGDKSRKSSLGSSELFKTPSSVSLADSLEHELTKAFESFLSSNTETGQIDAESPIDSKSHLSPKKDISSICEVKPESKPALSNRMCTPNQQLQATVSSGSRIRPSNTAGGKSPLHTDNSHQGGTQSVMESGNLIPVRNSPQQSKGEIVPGGELSPLIDQTSSPCRIEVDSTDKGESETTLLTYQAGRDHRSDSFVSSLTRRPSEGQGSQAAVLVSLLKSNNPESNEYVDV